MRSFLSYTKTLIEIVGFRISNFGMDDRVTGVWIPVMSRLGICCSYKDGFDGWLQDGERPKLSIGNNRCYCDYGRLLSLSF